MCHANPSSSFLESPFPPPDVRSQAPTVLRFICHLHPPAPYTKGRSAGYQPQLSASSPIATEKVQVSRPFWKLLGVKHTAQIPAHGPCSTKRPPGALAKPRPVPCGSPPPAGLLAPTTRLPPQCSRYLQLTRGTERSHLWQQRETSALLIPHGHLSQVGPQPLTGLWLICLFEWGWTRNIYSVLVTPSLPQDPQIRSPRSRSLLPR